MKKTLTFLLFLTLASFCQAHTILPVNIAHEFHISKCQIDYSESEKALQITMHIYLDDLEEALKLQGADKLFLCTDKEHKKAETYLYKYLQQRFQLMVNDTKVEFDFIGKEQSEDLQGVWCYLEITDVEILSSLEVTNNLLMEVFDDQKNIIHIQAPGNKQGYFLFQKGQDNDKVTF